jgi:hypothetical protein
LPLVALDGADDVWNEEALVTALIHGEGDEAKLRERQGIGGASEAPREAEQVVVDVVAGDDQQEFLLSQHRVDRARVAFQPGDERLRDGGCATQELRSPVSLSIVVELCQHFTLGLPVSEELVLQEDESPRFDVGQSGVRAILPGRDFHEEDVDVLDLPAEEAKCRVLLNHATGAHGICDALCVGANDFVPIGFVELACLFGTRVNALEAGLTEWRSVGAEGDEVVGKKAHASGLASFGNDRWGMEMT